ncbi:hypothetical protein CBS101457_006735 [Exobasidium rhododendri]|nr:hypothetical protein CBS101457_006735 [Exobasidium rhododendri]
MDTIKKASFAISYKRALQDIEYADERRGQPRDVPGISQLKEKYPRMLEEDKHLTVQKTLTKTVEDRIFNAEGDGKRWWTLPNEVNGDGRTFIGHETSFQVISDAMKEQGPFDGVIGFSTGAMMAGYCQALLCDPDLSRREEPTFQPPANQKPFKFALYFAPWLAMHGKFAEYMEDLAAKYSRSASAAPPSLCFVGVKDRILVRGSCSAFAKMVGSERLENHNGGHSIPFWEDYPNFLADWLSIVHQESNGQLTKGEAKRRRLLLRSPHVASSKRAEQAKL